MQQSFSGKAARVESGELVSVPLSSAGFAGDEPAYSEMCWRHESALRLYSIKCSLADAFFIRPEGPACRLNTQETSTSTNQERRMEGVKETHRL